MWAESIGPGLGAILGSSVTVAVIQLITNRFRYDRRADVVKSWMDELKIADDLISAAESEEDSSAKASKLAFARAVRTNLNTRLASQIAPRALMQNMILMAIVIILIFTFLVGMVAYPEERQYAIAAFIIAICVFTITASDMTGRERLHQSITSVLNGTRDPNSLERDRRKFWPNRFQALFMPQFIINDCNDYLNSLKGSGS